MRFYDRKIEINALQAIDKLAESNAQFTVLIGRRIWTKIPYLL